ncbi:hypothetical protein UB43_02140 [Pseudomonas sp. 21]|uniref:hypothetical protein n=1 Tax=unclassified Pseudomonas TaxID=196821 RepID=UPI0005EBC046|nr:MULTISPECIES: hypothetical protein [unclassified Pseudomonas]KJK03328.1 hypothetical protein UB43_02140 [Pseudomonas sp. 21]MBV7584848.1 hypothetical protein [Pseudomonas sp. PDM33]
MKSLLIAASLMIVVQPAFAAIPMLNYDCPNDIQIHTDENGPVYINGQEAKVTQNTDSTVVAKGEGVTVQISTNDDGTVSVSYTGPNGDSGVCDPAEGD